MYQNYEESEIKRHLNDILKVSKLMLTIKIPKFHQVNMYGLPSTHETMS